MWRDVFLHNKDAVLEMLSTFNEDLSKLTARSVAATAMRCSIISPARGQSGAASSISARIRPCRISGARIRRCRWHRLPGPYASDDDSDQYNGGV